MDSTIDSTIDFSGTAHPWNRFIGSEDVNKGKGNTNQKMPFSKSQGIVNGKTKQSVAKGEMKGAGNVKANEEAPEQDERHRRVTPKPLANKWKAGVHATTAIERSAKSIAWKHTRKAIEEAKKAMTATAHEHSLGTVELFASVKSGSLEQAEEAIHSSADVNATDEAGMTPVMYAAVAGHMELVNMLAVRGNADLRIIDDDFRCVLHHAARASNNQVGIIEQLVSLNADVDTTDSGHRTPLIAAAQEKNLPAVKALIAARADLTFQCREGNTAFDLVAALQDDEGHRISLVMPGADGSHQDEGSTPDGAANQGVWGPKKQLGF
jgi:hypothetical protein